jgi:hypothetical protein
MNMVVRGMKPLVIKLSPMAKWNVFGMLVNMDARDELM